MILFVVLAIILILCIIKWASSPNSSPYKKIPSGPFPLPIVGNLFSLSDLPHIPVSEYMYKHKYSIMSMKFGSLPVVFIKDPVLMHEAFVTKWKNFSSRTLINSLKIYTRESEGGSDIIYANGKAWKKYRRVVGAAFTRTKIRTQQQHLHIELEELNHQITKVAKQSVPVEFSLLSKRYSLNIIQRFLFGNSFSYNDNDDNETSSKLVHQVQEIMHRFGPNVYISDYIPILSFLDKNKFAVLKKELAAMSESVYPQIEEHKKNLDPENPKDLLDAILIEAQQHSQSGFFSDIDIMLVCFDMYLAATDTSSSSLDWFMYFLAKYPEYQERIFTEISSVAAATQYLKYADVDKAPLLSAAIQESNRMRPVAPLNVLRKNDEDDTIGGYFIPKNTTIFWNTYGYNHDPDVWSDPSRFFPERFFDTKNELHNFGAGPRICPGKVLGEEEVYQACAMLCQRFTWRLDSTQTDALDNGVASVVLHPNNYKLIFSAR